MSPLPPADPRCRSADIPAYCAPPSLRSVRNHPTRSQDRLLHHPQRPALLPDFIAKPGNSSPDETESGSSPTDHRFASGCSPPRLATTQLPSATRPWLTSTGTSTPQVVRHHGRTVSLRSTHPGSRYLWERAPDQVWGRLCARSFRKLVRRQAGSHKSAHRYQRETPMRSFARFATAVSARQRLLTPAPARLAPHRRCPRHPGR